MNTVEKLIVGAMVGAAGGCGAESSPVQDDVLTTIERQQNFSECLTQAEGWGEAYGGGVYYFPCVGDAFESALETFKMFHPELSITAVVPKNMSGDTPFSSGNFVITE